jgi:DNA polymerase-3 subunit epsilon
MTNTNLEELAETLRQSNKYQVLTQFEKVTNYNTSESKDGEVNIGLFLDLETTGLNHNTDQIIELALVPFEFTKDGRIFNVLDSYTSFQDPGINIPYNVTTLTGITNEMVANQVIDITKVKELVKSAALIIAHNAGFDRKFFDKHFAFSDCHRKIWACTHTQIPWDAEGIKSSKLEYIAYKYGFFYGAHRAEMDCLVGVHILAQNLPMSKERALKVLLENARKGTYRIWANDAPYDSKEILKARGYRWNDGINKGYKSWYKDVKLEEDKEAELDFLRQEIYKSEKDIIVDEISIFDRFSDRI